MRFNSWLQIPHNATPAPAALAHPGVLQRSAVGTIPASVPPIVHDVLSSPGRPLDRATRASMETRFGHSFSRVQVHSDARAAESARAVNARGYTVGQNVVFGAGQYAPATARGQKLLAHELAHTIQQESSAGSLQTAGISLRGNDRYEREAEAAANGIAAGLDARISPSGIAQGIQRTTEKAGGGQPQENDCTGYEKDPESLSVQTAKRFLDDVSPGGSRLVKTTECKANENRPERIECVVTFEDGKVINVSIESKLHNVEGQRPTPDGREWCVYHFTCDEHGVLQLHKKGCSADFKPKPSAPGGRDLVGSRSGSPAGGREKSI